MGRKAKQPSEKKIKRFWAKKKYLSTREKRHGKVNPPPDRTTTAKKRGKKKEETRGVQSRGEESRKRQYHWARHYNGRESKSYDRETKTRITTWGRRSGTYKNL